MSASSFGNINTMDISDRQKKLMLTNMNTEAGEVYNVRQQSCSLSKLFAVVLVSFKFSTYALYMILHVCMLARALCVSMYVCVRVL